MKRFNIDTKKYETPEVDALIAEGLAALKADETVYPIIANELKLTNKEAEIHLGALLDFQEDVHYCAACPGLENCDKQHPHFCLRLTKDGNVVTRHYDPCDKMLSLASFKKRYIRCSFPEQWRDEHFKTMDRSRISRKEALKAMIGAASGDGHWVYLTGRAGSGKSYMLACLANDMTTEANPGAYCDCSMLITELKNKHIENHSAFDELFNALVNASILVLDDFGNEFKSDYNFTNVLFPLLNARDRANKITAFASDFSIRDVVSMYRAKIGPERARQLEDLLKRRCVKEYDVTGVNVN